MFDRLAGDQPIPVAAAEKRILQITCEISPLSFAKLPVFINDPVHCLFAIFIVCKVKYSEVPPSKLPKFFLDTLLIRRKLVLIH